VVNKFNVYKLWLISAFTVITKYKLYYDIMILLASHLFYSIMFEP